MADKEDKERDERGWMGWLTGFLPSSFDDLFGLLIWGLLIGTGLYFLASSKTGQDLMYQYLDVPTQMWIERNLGDIIDFKADLSKLTAEQIWQHKGDLKMTDEQVHAVARNDVEVKELTELSRRMTGSASFDQLFYNDKALFTLLQTKPDYVLGLVRAFKNTGTAEQKNQFDLKRVIEAFKIIAGSERLGLLLQDAKTRGPLISIFAEICPIPFKNDALATFIQKVGFENNIATPAFKQFINEALASYKLEKQEERETSVRKSFVTFLGKLDAQANAQDVATLMSSVAIDAKTSPDRATLFTLLKNKNNAEATIQLIQDLNMLGGNTTSDVITALSQPDKMPALALIGNQPAIFNALQKWAKHPIDTSNIQDDNIKDMLTKLSFLTQQQMRSAAQLVPIAPAVLTNNQPDPEKIFQFMANRETRGMLKQNHLLEHIGFLANDFARTGVVKDPKSRESLRFLGTLTPGTPIYQNLNAFYEFFETMDKLYQAAPAARANDRQVLHAIYTMVLPPSASNGKSTDEFIGLKDEVIAAFFRDPNNRNAVGNLLKSLRTDNLEPAHKEFIAMLQREWLKPDGTGIGDLLSDPEAIQILKDRLNHKDNWTSELYQATINMNGAIFRNHHWTDQDAAINQLEQLLKKYPSLFDDAPPAEPASGPQAFNQPLAPIGRPLLATQVTVGAVILPTGPASTPAPVSGSRDAGQPSLNA